jgi:hypothetical protein
MSGFWAIFWLAVVMKIPIGMLLYIVWWAIKSPPVPEPEAGDGGSGVPRDPHPRMRPPHSPRRGPHAEPSPAPPERVRVAARALRAPERD